MKLDLSKVKYSSADLRRKIRIPNKVTANLAEEIGIHIGDGSYNLYNKRYVYSLRGHHQEKEYYENYLSNLYRKLYNININIRTWPDVLGFQFSSKAIGTFKHEVLGLNLGKKLSIKIPFFLFHSKKCLASCIRGFFDTDGYLNFEKKNEHIYPRIFMSNISKPLMYQIKDILRDEFKFNLSLWKRNQKNPSWNPLYRICIRGEKNLKKWFKLIGSNNTKHFLRYQYWIKTYA